MTNEQATPSTEQSSSSASNRAVKYSEPELDVFVGSGDTQKVFRCHGLILATYSDYIDALISAPMKEGQEKKITFPEITPEFWVKLMSFLEPGGSVGLALADFQELLPFCEKYQFRSALTALDSLFLPYLAAFTEKEDNSSAFDRSLVKTAVLTFQSALPRSKPLAVICAEKMFKLHVKALKLSELKSLVPLVENSEPTLATIEIIMDQENDGMEEIRKFIRQESFAAAFQARSRELDHQLEICEQLYVHRVEIRSSGSSEVNGNYIRCERVFNSKVAVNAGKTSVGIMRYLYYRDGSGDDEILLGPVDPFGNRWEIYSFQSEGNTKQYYWWESGGSSVVPPKYDWKLGEYGVKRLPEIRYSYGNGYNRPY